MCKQLFSKKEDSDYVKYKYKIIDRPIFIKVLWELTYSNALIKGQL